MPFHNIKVSEEIDTFITLSLRSGKYPDIDSMVEAALQLLSNEGARNDQKIVELRRAIQDGIESGMLDGNPFDQIRKELGLKSGSASVDAA